MKVSELFEAEERSVLSVIGKQPERMEGNFYCSKNKLTSLEGAPSKVTGDVYCYQNNLTSLKGAPTHVEGVFSCWGNKLTSLHNIHKIIKHIGEKAFFNNNPIKSHVLGLLLIDGLQKVYIDGALVEHILNKHLAGERDVFACQEELIDAGFEDLAQL